MSFVSRLVAGKEIFYNDGIYTFVDIASGSSADWVHEKLNVQLSYAYEFRDEGRYGFSLPADQIVPNSREIFASVVAMVKEAQVRGLA